jgi:hypothetical protein
MHMDARTDYTRLFAMVFGWVLLVVGILGFLPFLGGSATMQASSLLGIFPVNLLHNIVHILTGVLGLAAAYYEDGAYARTYALVFGIIYALVTVLGFIVAPGAGVGYLLGLSVNVADNLLHLVIAAAGLGAYFATANARTPLRRGV